LACIARPEGSHSSPGLVFVASTYSATRRELRKIRRRITFRCAPKGARAIRRRIIVWKSTETMLKNSNRGCLMRRFVYRVWRYTFRLIVSQVTMGSTSGDVCGKFDHFRIGVVVRGGQVREW
jgi:hypothetical protein